MASEKNIEIKNKELSALLEKDGPFPLEFAMQQFVPIYSVDHVEVRILTLHGSRYALITAVGRVTTTGWSEPHLQPYMYIQPPTDGIWDFVFVAQPPSGIVAEVITPIATAYVWKIGGMSLHGVRVHSATNSITEKIGRESHVAA